MLLYTLIIKRSILYIFILLGIVFIIHNDNKEYDDSFNSYCKNVYEYDMPDYAQNASYCDK